MEQIKDCPSCGYTSFQLVNFNSRLKFRTCSNCSFSSEQNSNNSDGGDEYEDIPSNRRKKELEIAEKIREELLPKQKVKIRLVKDWGGYGRTKFSTKPSREWWKNRVEYVLIAEKSFKSSRKKFVKTTIHELGHASDEVRFHPDFDPYSQPFYEGCEICGEKHQGVGHDQVWHDTYLNYRGKIMKKKFIKDYLKDKK